MSKLFLFSIISLAVWSCSISDKHVIEFDLNSGVFLDSENNNLALQKIIDKFQDQDTIGIAVSYPFKDKYFQFQSSDLSDQIISKLQKLGLKGQILLLPKFDKSSLFKGVYYEREKGRKKTQRILLVRAY